MDPVALAVAGVAGFVGTALTTFVVARRAVSQDVYVAPTFFGGWKGFFMGHMLELYTGAEETGAAYIRWTREARRRGKKAVQLQLVNQVLIAPLEPADIRACLDDHNVFVKPRAIYEILELAIGSKGLVTLRNEAEHATQRRLVGPAFAPHVLKAVADQVLPGSLGTLMAAFSAGAASRSPLEVAKHLDAHALTVTTEAAFRTKDAEQVQYLGKQFNAMMALFLENMQAVLPPALVPGLRRVSELRDEVRRTAMAGVQELRRQREAAADHGGAVEGLSDKRLLIDLLAETPGLTDETIADHSITFLLAGHETTSTAMMWILYFLAVNPRVQRLLFDELREAIALDHVPSLETVYELRYLQDVIRESMRLVPPIESIDREATDEVILPSGLLVPKGGVVHIMIHGVHCDAAIYGDDADVFRPERWESVELQQMVARGGAYLPFALGKRNCIGREFAMNEMLVTIAAIVRRFEVSYPPDAPPPYRRMVVATRTREPLLLTLVDRQES